MAETPFDEFKIEEFRFSDRPAKIVYPNGNFNGKLMFKTEYATAFAEFEVEMIRRGYAWCFIQSRNRWATDDEIDIKADFVKFVAEKLGIEAKCILVGMSCGGLQAAKLAERYPELVSVLYLDAPVLNILSLAGLGECTDPAVPVFWRELVNAYGFDKSTVVNFRQSPIDNMEPLIENDIPVVMLYGTADNVVIYGENGKVLEDFYKEKGGRIDVIAKTMAAHHPHGLPSDPELLIELVEKYL